MAIDALDRFLADLGTLYRARRLYPGGNDQVQRAAGRAAEALARWGSPVRIVVLGDEAVVEDRTLPLAGHGLEGLLRDLREGGCESVQIQPEVGAQVLTGWVEGALTGRVAEAAPGIAVGALCLAMNRVAGAPGATTGYLNLMPRVEEALADLAVERKEGLARAREIVASIAGHLAAGADLLKPIRDLKDHDNYTFTHALNVCALSSVLARALGASPDLVDHIALGALCHDVGKRQIPREVLNFAGPLSLKDREVMDGHPAHGARLLLGTGDDVHPLLPVIAYQHHMAADRSGYPRVPLPCAPHPASLLVAVADVFDAMRTVRPYRDARTVEEACTALVRDAAVGRLNHRQVAVFLGIFRVLSPGRPVTIGDGRRAVVLSEGPLDPLAPTVEAEDGQVLDLSLPGAPKIADILERPA